LSTTAELRLPLLWTAILAGRIKGGSIATATGVTGSDDVLKAILAGADAVMTTSALLRGGVGTVTDLVDGLRRWMEERDFASLDDMRGIMSWQRSKDRSVYTRANYLRILEHYTHS
jgi:dihydroorotate dehydrogenase (fumarate)